MSESAGFNTGRKPKSKYTLQTSTQNKQLNANNQTHLYWHDKCLYNIGDLSAYEATEVLYLHNNRIGRIENLSNLTNLTSLYLQHNKIKRIENLEALRKLKKLYLGYNEILVVENLTKLENLEELHVENQNLESGDSLCFEPRTIQSLGKTLQVINISSNNIYCITQLMPLQMLRVIIAGGNKLFSMEDICETIKNWHYLQEANFVGNPVCKKHRYKESIIFNTQQLVVLDGKDVPDTTRSFIKNFEHQKMRRGSMQSVNLAEQFSHH